MAGENGNPGPDLIARAAEAPGELEALQFMRLLLSAARQAGSPGAWLGGDVRPADEALRLRAAAGQAFASAEVVAVQQPPQRPVEVTLAFMGLTGPMGVLPDHYSDLVVQQRRARDPGLAEFLDLFNHRAISLFYRAWAKTRLPVRFEEAQAPFDDPFSQALASLLGLGLVAQQSDARLGDGGLLGLAGLMGRKVRSPGAVRRLAAAVLDMPVAIEELQGRWVAIAPEERTRLSAPAPGERAYSRLGQEAVAGAQVWDAQSRFRLRIGPLSLSQFHSFFEPGGPRAILSRTIRQAVGPTLAFDLQLVLRREEAPCVKLEGGPGGARLGQTSWLGASPSPRDRDEAVLPGA